LTADAGTADNPWAWQGGQNPYLATPFQILGLDVNLRGRVAIRNLVRTRRQRVRTTPERFPLFGRVLTESEVNQAEHAIAHPATRLLAELCTHRPRSMSVEVADLGERLAGLPASDPGQPEVVNVDGLREHVPRPGRRTFPPLWTDGADG
jgi:hypothetical protein